MEWQPLPENPAERAMFDSGTKLHGDVRLNIAHMLRVFAFAQPGGSFAEQCRIMANEVAKLELPAGVALPADFAQTKAEIMAMPEQRLREFAIAQAIQLSFHEKYGNAMTNANAAFVAEQKAAPGVRVDAPTSAELDDAFYRIVSPGLPADEMEMAREWFRLGAMEFALTNGVRVDGGMSNDR